MMEINVIGYEGDGVVLRFNNIYLCLRDIVTQIVL